MRANQLLQKPMYFSQSYYCDDNLYVKVNDCMVPPFLQFPGDFNTMPGYGTATDCMVRPWDPRYNNGLVSDISQLLRPSFPSFPSFPPFPQFPSFSTLNYLDRILSLLESIQASRKTEQTAEPVAPSNPPAATTPTEPVTTPVSTPVAAPVTPSNPPTATTPTEPVTTPVSTPVAAPPAISVSAPNSAPHYQDLQSENIGLRGLINKFSSLDRDGKGVLTLADLNTAAQRTDLNADEKKTIHSLLDNRAALMLINNRFFGLRSSDLSALLNQNRQHDTTISEVASNQLQQAGKTEAQANHDLEIKQDRNVLNLLKAQFQGIDSNQSTIISEDELRQFLSSHSVQAEGINRVIRNLSELSFVTSNSAHNGQRGLKMADINSLLSSIDQGKSVRDVATEQRNLVASRRGLPNDINGFRQAIGNILVG